MKRSLAVAPALFAVLAGCTSEDAGEADPAIPGNAFCAGVLDWDPGLVALEDEVLALVNEHRAAGASCGGQGDFASTHALEVDGALRCAARVHSKAMVEQGFFAHDSPSGETTFDRIEKAGYDYQAAGENIAQGYATSAEAVAGWMDSDGHCANIMSPTFEHTGIGVFEPATWTQTFGAR